MPEGITGVFEKPLSKVEQALTWKRRRRRKGSEAFEVFPGVMCVKLTQGRHTLVDTADYPKVEPYFWFAVWIPDKKTYYAVTPIKLKDGTSGLLPMQNLLMFGFPEGAVTDEPN